MSNLITRHKLEIRWRNEYNFEWVEDTYIFEVAVSKNLACVSLQNFPSHWTGTVAAARTLWQRLRDGELKGLPMQTAADQDFAKATVALMRSEADADAVERENARAEAVTEESERAALEAERMELMHSNLYGGQYDCDY